MRILYISQYFPPETGATQSRAYEMTRNLVQLGHHVTVLTEIPNHPSGLIPAEYRNKVYERSNLEGIDVIRVWVKASPNKNIRNRLMFYISFMFSATIAGLLFVRGKFDLIYATSPPLFVGGSALIINVLKRIPFVFEVRDLWPESARVLGQLQNSIAITWATRLEEACYRRAKRIIVVTRGIQQNLEQRDIPAEKMANIPNGSNIDIFRFSSEKRELIRNKFNLEGKFLVIYAGILGLAYDFVTLIESAKLLHNHKNIHFFIIGDGPQKYDISQLINEYQLSNLTTLSAQPYEQIPDYLSAADLSIIPLLNNEFFRGTLPVKMFDSWSCQCPVLLCNLEGEASRVIQQADAGITIPPEDPEKIEYNILQLKNSPALLKKMGVNGRKFVSRYYSRHKLAIELTTTLEDVIETE